MQPFFRPKTVFFVIDVQNKSRYDEALEYLKAIIKAVKELNPKLPPFNIMIHKYDPDLKDDKDTLVNYLYIRNTIEKWDIGIDFNFFKTSIHDDATVTKAFSDGVIAITKRGQLAFNLLTEYMGKSFNSAALILDKNFYTIASRATTDQYKEIIENSAVRLATTMERLKEWEINAKDNVTNIEFPKPDEEGQRDGILFIRTINIEDEKLYLIALCLNKKIESQSYKYLPLLTESLENLFKN